jgi:glucosyl-3-phosphoglycerate phosphatase
VTRLIFWRHGQTDYNAAARVQGQYDAALSDIGQAQAAAAAKRLAALSPDAIYSSDLQRAADTAAALAEETGLPVTFDERLRERHFGEWQGLLLSDIRDRWPEAFARWQAGEPVTDVGIEELDEVAKRVAAAVHEFVAAAPSTATIVVTTHGGAAKHGAGAVLGWPPSVTRLIVGLDNGHWTELVFGKVRGWQLRAHNVGVEPDRAR